MNILPELRTKIKYALHRVPPKWKRMMTLGVNAFSLTPFVSLNSNARVVSTNPFTGMRNIARLCAHPKLCGVFSSLLLALCSISNTSIICMDFTIFDPFAVLVLALQTGDGRAIPVWLDIIKYPIEKNSQNIFILDTLREFLALVRCHPKIVCDRGFIGEHLIRGFMDLGLKFYVRMKAGVHMKMKRKWVTLSSVYGLDVQGTLYHEQLRVVRSSRTLQHKLHAKECWYIVTNDFKCTRDDILLWYYHRFEIEECFKDIKHILNTNPRWFQKSNTLKTLLWFQVFGIWILSTVKNIPQTILHFQTKHAHKKLSWIRQLFEWITRERTALIVPVQESGKGVIML